MTIVGAYRSMRSVALADLMLFLAAVACSSHGAGPRAAAEPACDTRVNDAEPPVHEPLEPEVPQSRVVVEIRAPLDRLERVLARNVPATLAQSDHQPIGAAGVARYRVQRGGFSIGVDAERLVVRTPIRIHIEVSKAFGPLTVNYGRCDPELVATVTLPLRLTEAFGVEPPSVTTAMVRGCTIAVVDVSNEIQSEARRQTESLERQIRREAARIPELARAAFRPFVLPLSKGGCARFRARQFTYEIPRIEAQALVTRVGLVGELELGGECSAPPDDSAVAPVAYAVERLDADSVLRWRADWAYDELAAALAAKARRAPPRDGSQITDVGLRPGSADGRPNALLHLGIQGRICGSTWLSAVPAIRGDTRIGFDAPKPYSATGDSSVAATLTALVGDLDAPLPAHVAEQLADARTDFEAMVSTLSSLAGQQKSFTPTFAAPRAAVEAELGPERLGLLLELHTRAAAELE